MVGWELMDVAVKCRALLLGRMYYVRLYAIDMAYITPLENDESPKTFRRRLCVTLHTMETASRGERDVKVTTLQPTTNWPKVWHNLHTAWITVEMKSVRFTVIHDIIPTNVRLSKIHLTDTNRCMHCGRTDTLLRRITECNDGKDIQEWTRARLAAILRTNPLNIPAELTLRISTSGPHSGMEQFYRFSPTWYITA
jgi:hypothetical protein